MGLGSWQSSPLVDVAGFGMLTVQTSHAQEAGEGGEGSSGDSSSTDPPAEKYPRLSSSSNSNNIHSNNIHLPSPPSSVTPPAGARRDPPTPPSSGETHEGGGGETNETSTAVSGRARGKKPTRGSSPPTIYSKEALHRGVLPVQNDQEASSESQSQEGISNPGDGIVLEEASGCGAMEWDREEKFSSSFSFAFAGSSPPSPSSSCFPPPGGMALASSRRQRKFTPDERKDVSYWEKRRKNNEAARKSREKRRLHDMMLENRIVDLEQDNGRLRMELQCLKTHYGIPLEVSPVLLAPRHREADGTRRDDSPPTLPVIVGGLCEGGVVMRPPALTPMVSGDSSPSSSSSPPPPLLHMPARVLPPELEPMGMAGMFSAQASSLPAAFFVSAISAAEVPVNHLAAPTHPVTHPVIPPAHQHDRTAVMVKRESEEDEVTGLPLLQCSLLKHNYRELDGMPPGEYREMYPPRYAAAASPQDLATPAVTLPAHCGWSDAVPMARYQLEQFATAAPLHYSWQPSPLSSHSSDDTSDEPLQLTVHRRGSSKSESVEEDSGSEGVSVSKDRAFGTNNCASSNSSLPLKLRHKRPLTLSPPLQANPEGLSSTRGPSLSNGLTHLSSDLTSTQDAPLSLIKKEATADVGLDTAPGQGIGAGCMKMDQDYQTDPRLQDAKYLERRRRNNEAARKSRENRRNMTKLWEVKSNHLQSENSHLRQELDSLQEEMRQLSELLDQKQAVQDPQGLPQESSSSSPPPQQQSQKRTAQRLQQLEEERRLLKREQRRQEKRTRQKRQQQQQQQQREVRNDDLRHDEDLDHHGDVN